MHDLTLRVSVATLDKVVFPRSSDGVLMLALERKAARIDDRVHVRAQPFGGAVRILNLDVLRELIHDFSFDSKRSEAEQDFRLLIRPTDWKPVKQFCMHHLQNPDDAVLESDPQRELIEEFAECLQVNVQPDQYVYQPLGFAIENAPTLTSNIYSREVPTVRIYRIFEVRIVDDSLCRTIMTTSERASDSDLQTVAWHNGRANSVLSLPIDLILNYYLNISPQERYSPEFVEGHQLDTSVLAVLDKVEVPQFQRE